MIEPFFKPRLHGPRFTQHSVPLEVLKDFAALEEMLIEVAKREYLSANPTRQQTPRGFAKGLELHLAAVEEGSTVLAIVLTGLSLFPSSDSEYIQKAGDKIVGAIASVEKGTQPALHPELLRYFDRFGRSLLDGESIEFTLAEGGTTSLTPDIRQRLLRASEADEWTEEATYKGKISAADQSDKIFELELSNGSKLKAPLEQQHLHTILDAFVKYQTGCTLAVQGIIKRERSGRPKSFESVEHINQLDPLDVETRLEDLAALKAGWLNGKGAPLDPTGLRALAKQFDKNFDAELPLPHLYPTAEGGVQAEWSIGEWEVSLEIDLKSQIATYQALYLPTGECQDHVLELTENSSDWATLNESIRNLLRSRPA